MTDEIQKERFIARIDNIKEHVPLAKVVVDLGIVHGDVVVGGEFQLKCPFHGKDSKPSAHVYPDGLFHCFTCKRHYNVVHFVSNYKGISFGEACRWIESAYSVPKIDFVFDEKRNELRDQLRVKMGAGGTELDDKGNVVVSAKSFVQRYSELEKKLIQNRKTLGLETYAKALLGLDLIKESESVEHIDALEKKVDAKLEAV